MTFESFQQKVNKARKSGTWYSFIETVDGKEVKLKAYKTWLQIYKINGIDYSNLGDQSVKQFSNDLVLPFE